MDGVAVPGPHGQLGRADRQRHVPHELGEPAVEHHLGQVRPQCLPRLARHLAGPVDELGQTAEVADPLGRRLLPDPRDARQVVAGVAAQGGEVRVLARAQAVLLLDGRRGHPGEVGDALLRVQHRHGVAHQLVGVPITGDDRHVEPVALGLVGEGGDHVVGLEALGRHHRDGQRGQHLLDQADLPLERIRRARPVRLVRRVLRAAEGLPPEVERHGEVGRTLVTEGVDEHRGEAVDRVGGLAGGGGEVLHREREERAVGQGMPVEQEQPPGPGGGGRDGRRCRCHGADPRPPDRHRFRRGLRREWSPGPVPRTVGGPAGPPGRCAREPPGPGHGAGRSPRPPGARRAG